MTFETVIEQNETQRANVAHMLEELEAESFTDLEELEGLEQ